MDFSTGFWSVHFHIVFTVKVTGKNKKGKKLSKTLKCAVTVKTPSIAMNQAEAEVAVNDTVKLSATTKPASSQSSVTYSSDKTDIATVAADGTVTGIAAGEATVTATAKCGTKTLKTTAKVTVKETVAELSGVTQTASNAFTAAFTADASKTFTKDDFKVAAADGSVELAVKSVEFSADGKTAAVTLFGNFTNATAYKITCKDKVVDLTAKIGAVARIAIETASAEQNVETPINFRLFDADGIDVTPGVPVDTTCYVTVTGDYSAFNNAKPSAAKITMNEVGKTAEVTVKYNSNAAGAQDVTATQTITCVDAKAVQGTKLFASTTNTNTYAGNGCAKFYLGLSDSEVKVGANGATNPNVYFCAKDASGDVISYDTYEVESSNDAVAAASLTKDSGKFAKITVTGNSKGSAQLNIKATKNGKDTFYTIPVSVTDVDKAASMEVSVDRPTMSNVNDSDYVGKISVTFKDKDGNTVSGSYRCELETQAATPIVLSGVNNEIITAAGKDAKTYTIKVTGSDNSNDSTTFEKRVTVTVKDIPTGNPLKLSYQVELSRTKIDENPSDTTDDAVTARLYATYNGLFAGYVRDNGGAGQIAGGTVTATAETELTNLNVCAKFGTQAFTPGADGCLATPQPVIGAAVTVGSSGDMFDAVLGSVVKYDVAKKESISLAKTGTYTVVYSYRQNGKNNQTTTKTFTVSNSVFIPTVTVLTRNVDTLNPSDIIAALKTDVDMNNDQSAHESIDRPVTTLVTTAKEVVKSVEVVDNYSSGTWTFVVPVNATFTSN